MVEKIYVPPIKIQGIKTKLVELIAESISLEEDSIWYEPFMGSGVVGLNLAPKHAVFADTNPYVIALYNAIKSGEINSYIVREFLEREGRLLAEKDEIHYYYIRDRFNEEHNPLDFLFLNRSCFNGMIRFNKNYKFNVPYGHKPERFAKAYVTKIVNQVKHLESVFPQNDWRFKCQSFVETIREASSNDFIYCDPPYIGRHVDYYDSWDEESEIKLRDELHASGAKFMLSTWDQNKYRKNEYIDTVWRGCYKLNQEHFYHVGAKESNRNAMMEALLMNYDPKVKSGGPRREYEQLLLCIPELQGIG
ncbi:MAG: Dam family site-specific DNA-(adenine-N6)-methyltransferase [Lachnospiraceae bacterium]|nr:Dam family site-specific DNA-(adenine-N6)-methyltransferase [Lachnospiraceae bacterium]